MKRTEKVLLMVFLVVSVICGKYLLDYWRDSYDNRQNYRQVEEMAFPEKDTEMMIQNPMQIIQRQKQMILIIRHCWMEMQTALGG